MSEVKSYRSERNNYMMFRVSDNTKSVDVRIKAGERLHDIVVVSNTSNEVDVQFSSNDEICRIYHIVFPKDERLCSWGKGGIETNKRFIALNWIQE